MVFRFFFRIYLTNVGHKKYDSQAKIRPCERHNRNPYLNIIRVKLVTQVKKNFKQN